ncbi:MAG: hypothetical protein P0Y53_13335 [Candidatus Pseudobacter hemicellulosilyticus]|uniref:Uncharacterized protein n=1 Tax=Candidatus Pseudobacter hemicellulosilyticus TaxID=3121375 RepID=A0AAJ6BDX2_9BACT|nr:MAG: hypothetical protein P0Y53_13335 [Pseudobacter sp.]
MYSYALLESGYHYLVQEKEESPVTLIKITVETDHCLYVTRYGETPVMEWKKKNDPIFEILELLSDDKVQEWQSVYNDSEDAYYEEDDE